jgi:3-oxoacyl-[acyl-carrier protein] reductase
MTKQQTGRVLIVTGAAQGIGSVIATEFARAGWSVAAMDRQKEKLAAFCKGADTSARICPVVVDVCSEASVRAGVSEVESVFGRIDALINNAALFTQLKRRPLLEIPLDEWNRVLSVNLTGPFLMTRAVAGAMQRSGGGSIVNISTVGIYHGSNQLAHYNSSKAGLIGLTRTAARELGPLGIRVNAIAPGATATEAVHAVSSIARLEDRARSRCLARIQTPQDLIGPLKFLTSEEANFVTGQLINVDGGEFFH